MANKINEKLYKHDKPVDTEFTNLYKKIDATMKEATAQKSIKVSDTLNTDEMTPNVIHIFKDSTGVRKARIKIGNDIFQFTITQV